MSIQGESYILILNSQGSNVLSPTLTAANRSAITYDVNWASFLPKKYKKFRCQVNFKSIAYNGVLSTPGFISMRTGTTNIYDGYQMSSNIAMISTIYHSTTVTFYSASSSDNCDFYMNYPTSNQVTILLNSFVSGTILPNTPFYCMYISFTGVPDDQMDNSI